MITSGCYGLFAFAWTVTHNLRRENHRVNCWVAQKGLHGHTIGNSQYSGLETPLGSVSACEIPFGRGLVMAWNLA